MPRAPRIALASPAARLGLGLGPALALGLLVAPGCASAPAPAPAPFTLQSSTADAGDAADLEPLLQSGMSAVSDTLGLPWLEPLTVAIVPDRGAFTASFPPELGLAETECWMVAWAVAERLTVLAPRNWATEACEHDAADREQLELLLRHELVHALHGQHNPTRDFTGMDELGWFVEGLATFASGQLEHGHERDAREALAAGVAPRQLATAWSGRYRYGVCGSLVAYLDQRCGRARLRAMMGATTQPQVLAIVGLDEDELLAAWAVWASG